MQDEPEFRYSDFTAMLLAWLVFTLPFTTPLLLASNTPWAAYMQSPYLVYAVGCGLIMAGHIATKDPWLGAAIAWPVLMVLWVPKAMSYQTTITMLLSGFALTVIWTWRDEWVGLAKWALVGAAVFQACYAMLQPFGEDFLWGLHDNELVRNRYAAVGTIGNNNWLGVYFAMLMPIMPIWAGVFVVGGLIASKCLTGIVAAACGVAWMDKKRRWYWLGAGLLVAAAVMLWRGKTWPTGILERFEVWAFVAKTMPWWQWLIGAGPGSWSDIVPFWQLTANQTRHALFLQGHNEPFQIVFETGLIGLGLIAAFVYANRKMFAGPYGGSLVAMGVASLTMFGFRLAILGCTALVIIGLATRDTHASFRNG